MNGWVKFHRTLIDKPVWRLPDAQRIIFVTILLMASHYESSWIWKGQRFTVQPGQLFTSLESIAEKARVSVKSVRTALKNLEKLEFLANESASNGRLITVINWARYQSPDKISANEAADERQASGRRAATFKKDKKEKNEKEPNIYSEVLEYLNRVSGTKYRVVEAHKKLIRARVKEGYCLKDFQTVIDNKRADWLGTDHAKYLRPETLFGTKFDGYLNQKRGGGKREMGVRDESGNAGNDGASDRAGKIPEEFWR